jgi:uncharacterized membrane protein
VIHILDTLRMCTRALVSNKLRSVLTLVGIVAGVASIIAVMTAISVVQAPRWRALALRALCIQHLQSGEADDPAG